jgi:putative RNA 2'-phosphotransferase
MNNNKNISKFLSLVLRHKPESIGITLDENGWVSVTELLEKINAKGTALDKATLQMVVDTNDKKRFTFNEDGTKIRANQGHSITVDLALQTQEPPTVLYHGTVAKHIDAIKKEGLLKMSRQHVHLSKDVETATIVGNRRGKAIILTIDTKAMIEEGYPFYLSENNVWLTDHVPSRFIELSFGGVKK